LVIDFVKCVHELNCEIIIDIDVDCNIEYLTQYTGTVSHTG